MVWWIVSAVAALAWLVGWASGNGVWGTNAVWNLFEKAVLAGLTVLGLLFFLGLAVLMGVLLFDGGSASEFFVVASIFSLFVWMSVNTAKKPE